MPTLYKDFRPTQFDPRGLALADQQNWLVLDLSQTRDSENIAKSNFSKALELLGGESETVEVHRFGHWGPGWYEIIIIDPSDETAVKTAEGIESTLSDYPVLDDMDLSQREDNDYQEAWLHWMSRDFADCLQKHLGLSDDTTYAIWSGDMDLQGLYKELTPSGDYWEDNYMGSRLRNAASRCTRDRMVAFLKTRHDKKHAKVNETVNEIV